MKVQLTTVYENVDDDWLKWYIQQLKKSGVPIDFEGFEDGKSVNFSSNDPTSNVVATTTYQVLK